MSAEHTPGCEPTPGPWIASGNRVYMGAAMEWREVAVATKADPVIRYAAVANARLIALAPEMLDALEDAREYVAAFAGQDETGAGDDARAMLRRIDGLLARARPEEARRG